MFNLMEWLGLSKQPTLQVDFTQLPILPRDAKEICTHNPISDYGSVALTPKNFQLVKMPPTMTYREYIDKYSNEKLCNALILDAFVDMLKQKCDSWKHWEREVNKFFGIKSGQIFFLGTSFYTEDKVEAVTFLNINTDIPSLRNLCPAKHQIRDDINVYSCVIK